MRCQCTNWGIFRTLQQVYKYYVHFFRRKALKYSWKFVILLYLHTNASNEWCSCHRCNHVVCEYYGLISVQWYPIPSKYSPSFQFNEMDHTKQNCYLIHILINGCGYFCDHTNAILMLNVWITETRQTDCKCYHLPN